MAQSGYTPILIYASGTATNVPLAANMTSSASGAELALNYADGKLYYKNSSGVVTLLASSTTVTNSFSAGSTGLTPNTATTGAVTLAGTLITSNGGTGLASYTAGDLSYYASGTALTKLAIGTNGYILQSTGSAPSWVAASTVVGGAAGSTGQVQFNNAGALGASANLFWDNTNARLGIGTNSPTQALEVNGNAYINVASGNPYLQIKTGGAGNNPYIRLQASTTYWDLLGAFSNSNDDLIFGYGGTTLFDMTSGGNTGIGGVPLGAYGNRRSLEIFGNGVASLGLNGAIGEIGWNTYITAAGANTYYTTGPAAILNFNNNTTNGFSWLLAASGTGGTAISAFTTAMALDTTALWVGATAGSYTSTRKLQVANGMTIGYGAFTMADIGVSSNGTLTLTANSYPANVGSNTAVSIKAGTSGGGGPAQLAYFRSDGVNFINSTGSGAQDLNIRYSDGAGSGWLGLNASSAGGGGGSGIVMGNNDSGGVSGPTVISSANGVIQFGRGNSFTSRTAGTVTSWWTMIPQLQRTLTADETSIQLLGSYTGNPTIIQIGQSSSDGFIAVSDASGSTTRLTGYTGGFSYFSSRVAIGGSSASSSFQAGIGGTSGNPNGLLVAGYSNGNDVLMVRSANATSSGSSAVSIFRDSTGGLNYTGGTLIFNLTTNGGLANYQSNDTNLSDRREKTDIEPAGSYLEKMCAIPVVTFNYIEQGEDDQGKTLGAIAQDVQAVAPEFVTESNWGEKTNPKMRLSIYQTDLQYGILKALQELKAEFDAYKASHP